MRQVSKDQKGQMVLVAVLTAKIFKHLPVSRHGSRMETSFFIVDTRNLSRTVFLHIIRHFFCSVLVRNSAILSLDSRERSFCSLHSGINSLAAMHYSSAQLKRLLCGNEAASNIP